MTLELLVAEVTLVCSVAEATVGAADELDGTEDVVVGVVTAGVEPAALEEVVAAGSELPQPVTSTATAVAVAMNTDLDASMHFMVVRVAVHAPR